MEMTGANLRETLGTVALYGIEALELMAATSISVCRDAIAAVGIVVVAAGAEKAGHELANERLESGDRAADDGHVELNDTPHEGRGCSNWHKLETCKSKKCGEIAHRSDQ